MATIWERAAHSVDRNVLFILTVSLSIKKSTFTAYIPKLKSTSLLAEWQPFGKELLIWVTMFSSYYANL